MREPWEWEKGDLEALLREQRPEDLRLEYKRSDALAKTEGKKSEISKDVSALANSAGGTIIYGIDEQRKTNGPLVFDAGIDPSVISADWLEQVIDANIQRRIDGVLIHSIPLSSTGRRAYLVWVPQSNRAPHMAADHRYYKRLGTTTALMEEYEVRDVGRRLEAPDLSLALTTRETGRPGFLALEATLTNHASEPVLYATIRMYIDTAFQVEHAHLKWSQLPDDDLAWMSERTPFHVVRYSWSVPPHHPILEGESYQLPPITCHTGIDNYESALLRILRLGWEVRAPKALPKREGIGLLIDQRGARIITERTYHLSTL